MKKLFFFLALLFPLGTLAQNVAFNGYCTLGGAQSVTSGLKSSNYLQGIIDSCTVTVYFTGTSTKATIYSSASGNSLTNPFTANTNGSWLFFAVPGIGYDVMMNGGIPPNTYPNPVTLTDLLVGGGGGGSGVTQVQAGNLTPIFSTSVANPTTTPDITFSLDTTGPLNFLGNCTGATADPVYCTLVAGTNISLTPSGGDALTISAITTPTILQTQVIPPVAGQFVVLYPTTNGLIGGGTGENQCGSGIGVTGQAIVNNDSGQVTITCYGYFFDQWSVNWGGFSLPSYVNPSNITAIYAFMVSGLVNPNGSDVGSGLTCTSSAFGTYSLSPGGTAWGYQQVNQLTTINTSAGISAATCEALLNFSGLKRGSSQLNVGSVGLIVYYTGPPPPVSNAVIIAPPLIYALDTLGIDSSAPFPGIDLLGGTVAKLPIASTATNNLYFVYDGATTTDCTTGGGSDFVECVSNGSTWSAFGGGGGGTVTSFAAPSVSWPTWLVPTVANSTTTPSLTVVSSLTLAAVAAGASSSGDFDFSGATTFKVPITGHTASCLYAETDGTVAGTDSACGSGSGTPIGLTVTVVDGVAASPAVPYMTAPNSGSITACIFTTTTSDSGSNLVMNVQLAGTSIFSGGSQTISAGTSAKTQSTLTLTGTISVTSGNLWEFDITTGAADWTGSLTCH